MYLSTNSGTNWSQLNNGLTSNNVHSLAVNGIQIVAGTYGSGMFLSTNNGTNWTEVNSGLTRAKANCLTISETNIFTGTIGAGVWRRPLSEFTVITKEVNNLPHEFTLDQNYRNPWNPTTTINYSIAKEGIVKLTVYNAIGSKVATVIDGYKPAGNYSVQFNSSGLASGIYLYRLEAENFSSAKKFIIMK